ALARPDPARRRPAAGDRPHLGHGRAPPGREDDPHRRPARLRRAQARSGDAQGERLHRGALRELHRAARPQGRSALHPLQPGAPDRAARVPPRARDGTAAPAELAPRGAGVRGFARGRQPRAAPSLGPLAAADARARRERAGQAHAHHLLADRRRRHREDGRRRAAGRARHDALPDRRPRRRAPRAARGPPGRTLRRRGRGAGRRRGRRARRHQRQLPGRFGEQAPGGREHDGDDGRPRHGPRDHGGCPADADGGRRAGRAGRRGRRRDEADGRPPRHRLPGTRDRHRGRERHPRARRGRGGRTGGRRRRELQLHDGHAGHGDRGDPCPRARGRRLRGDRALHHGRPLVAGGADRAARESAAARAGHASGGVMIDRIIEYSARNRFLVILLVALASAAGVWSLRTSPLDALPDLSDVQLIVVTDCHGRSPDLVEDQITYPIVTTMIAAPRVKYVRGESMFGYSFVNVVFADGTDLYWARSRVLEYMQGITGRLPEGVAPRLGPDATGVGWVYEYALVDRSGTHTLADLRSFQDWTLRYWLASVEGVPEVASVGGFVKQYQVEI